MDSASKAGTVIFLFTDIEGSSRLWEQEPERMQPALARHDALVRAAIEVNRGIVVKTTGDGVYAAFDDAVDAVAATVQFQEALADPESTHGVPLRVRCGLHAGVVERRDNDFFGSAVNRASRVMGAAHGGQVLLSQAVVDRIRERLPDEVSLRDLGAVRLRDLASPERVYQVVHPRLRQDFPVLRSLEATPNNLPQQVNSFIGRQRELDDVGQLLTKSRLVTLLGVGGLGKTRLSLQVAADVLDDYPDGVWLVELAPLSDARLVAQAVASVLGVKEEVGGYIVDALLNHVRDRALLLILDNCEHLLHACADLAWSLLQAGPQLKIVASSREPLRVTGEASYPLSPLSVPGANRALTVAALTQYEAVRLFVDRAVAAQPAFEVTRQNAATVTDICHRLDGIPLALELAAARVRALSVEKIAARLSDRFRLLTGGDRTTLPRQQTLRACIDWSYDLLAEPERVLLRRLSVFAGGFTLEATEAVGAGGAIDATDVLDFLTRLVEKSLVGLDAEGGRYRLLETVREYAYERLIESGEEKRIRTRHLTFYVAMVEDLAPKLRGAEQGALLSGLDLEWENLLSAHAWCDHADEGSELGLQLVSAMKNFWLARGLAELGYRVTVEALAREGAREGGLARCRALFVMGQLGCFLGRYGEVQGCLEESVRIARDIGDLGRATISLALLGTAALGQGDRVTARRYLEEAVAGSRTLADKRRLAWTLSSLAELHRVEANPDAAEPLYEEALALDRELGDRGNAALGLSNLARVAVGRGSEDRARRALLEALAIAGKSGSKSLGHAILDVAVGLCALVGERARAARFFGAAETLEEQTGFHREPADAAFLLPRVAKVREALGATQFATAEAAGRALSYEAAMVEVRAWLESPS